MLNENIRKLRISQGISQVDLARALGVSKQSVSNWENDNIQPSIDMLIKIAKHFSVSTDYLLGITTHAVLDVSGLDAKIVAHLRLIIDDIKNHTN